jgi:hypothetical protein
MNDAELERLIEEMQRLRGWIANSYAQVEYILGDIIIRFRNWPIYDAQTKTMTHSASKRIAKVRAMLAIDGPLTPFADESSAIINRFDDRHETRNLLAHGFCEFHWSRSGTAGMEFRKFHRQPDRDDAQLIRAFTTEALEAEKVEFTALATDAVNLYIQIHRHFGWVGFVP